MNKSNFKLEDIVKVKEISQERQVNKHISVGWKLLNVITKDFGYPDRKHEYTAYVLGWDITQDLVCKEWDVNGHEIENPLKEYKESLW